MSEASLGTALRAIGGGEVQVMTRHSDFNMIEVEDGGGDRRSIPAMQLVAFVATDYREVGASSDVWEFHSTMPAGPATPAGQPVIKTRTFLRGTDILMVRAVSKL